MRRRREQILLGGAVAALVLGVGLGHVLARATGGRVDAGMTAAGQLDLTAAGASATGTTVPSFSPAASSAIPVATLSPEPPAVTEDPASAAPSSPSSSTTTAIAVTVPAAVPASTTSTQLPTTAAPSSTAAATAATPPPSAGLNRLEQGVLDAVNVARQAAGCPPLTVDAALQAAAHAYARLMVDKHWFDHKGPDGQSPTDRARAAGYKGGVGENLMMGFKDDPMGAVADPRYGWLQSDGHRANILNCDYRRTGVGYDPGNIQSGYADGAWVQMFG